MKKVIAATVVTLLLAVAVFGLYAYRRHQQNQITPTAYDSELGTIATDRVNVIFKPNTSNSRIQAIAREINGSVTETIPEIRAVSISLPWSKNVTDIKWVTAKLKMYPEVESAEPNGFLSNH